MRDTGYRGRRAIYSETGPERARSKGLRKSVNVRWTAAALHACNRVPLIIHVQRVFQVRGLSTGFKWGLSNSTVVKNTETKINIFAVKFTKLPPWHAPSLQTVGHGVKAVTKTKQNKQTNTCQCLSVLDFHWILWLLLWSFNQKRSTLEKRSNYC